MIDLCYLFFVFAAYYTNASPIALPQAVTALISPSAPSQPGCTGSYPGVFGIAVMNISTSTPETTSATLPRRRQESESRPAPIFTMAAVSQIGDGQVQGGMHTLTMAPVSQIEDGQIQNSAAAFAAGYSGQQSAACATATATSTASSTSMIGDKPPTVLEQACGISVRPTASPVMLLPPSGGDAASASASAAVPSTTTSVNISTSSSRTSISTSSPTSTAESAPSSPPRPLTLVSCLTNSTLRLSLNDGVLVDGKNRTGYIASNLQFQFDGPPQSGAIYTAGWSVCPVDAGDGGQGQMSLALGGNTTFYQCLSGKFYNLYTENWAAQCSPVQLRVVRLVDC